MNSPPEQRVASTCMPPDHGGELYLDCRSQGVIKVISSRHGYTSLHACPSDIIKGDLCAVTDGEQTVDVIRDRCMGQTDCHVSVSAVDLPTCSLKSNYAQSVYECVESKATGADHSIIDVFLIQGTVWLIFAETA